VELEEATELLETVLDELLVAVLDPDAETTT
jgi:hypothetical protein